MLGWVAAVSATESPSQLSPELIQKNRGIGFLFFFGGKLACGARDCPTPTQLLRCLRSASSPSLSARQARAPTVCGSWSVPPGSGARSQKGTTQDMVRCCLVGHRPALVARQADGEQATPARLLEGAYEVGGIAEVDSPTTTSPGRCRKAAIWRAKTTLK